MKSIAIHAISLAIMLTIMCGCGGSQPDFSRRPADSVAVPDSAASIELSSDVHAVDSAKVPFGAVKFTASIKNEGKTAITIAHPAICEPDGYDGTARHFNGSHGKSEILLKIVKPGGEEIVLRDGYMHFFDPGNVPVMIIPPNGIGTFHVGWFFENSRGRWERDDVASKVFLVKGKYAISILFRNVYPKARLYDEKSAKVSLIDVWTGFMESRELIVEIK